MAQKLDFVRLILTQNGFRYKSPPHFYISIHGPIEN